MGKQIIMLGGNEIKNVNFTAIKIWFFKKDVNIENILISTKICSGEKIHKYFIGYMDDDYKIYGDDTNFFDWRS